MSLANSIESALKEIEVLQGSKTFDYNGETYLCHVGSQSKSTVLESSGFDETQQIVLAVRKSSFSDGIYPEADDEITYREITYYVDTVTEDPTETFLNLALKKTK